MNKKIVLSNTETRKNLQSVLVSLFSPPDSASRFSSSLIMQFNERSNVRRKNSEQSCLQRPSHKTAQLYPDACQARKIRGNPKSSRNKFCTGGLRKWSYRYHATGVVQPYSLDEKLFNPITFEQKPSADVLLVEEDCYTIQWVYNLTY